MSSVLVVGVVAVVLSGVVTSQASLIQDRNKSASPAERATENVPIVPGGATGGDVSAPGTVPEGTAEQDSQAISKLELGSAYEKWQKGGTSDSELREEISRYEKRYGQQALGQQTTQATFAEVKHLRDASRNTGEITTLGFTAVRRVQGVAHHAQSKSYYCGPAAAYSIIEYVRGAKKKSAWDGKRLSQNRLASASYLNTESHRATPWSAGRMKIALNRWISGSNKGWYVDKASPTASQFKKALAWNIDRKHPFAVDAVEMGGGRHYNGHPVNQTIGHWLVVRGYSGSGSVAHFVDPIAKSPAIGWSRPRPYFTASPTVFAKNFLRSNGMTW